MCIVNPFNPFGTTSSPLADRLRELQRDPRPIPQPVWFTETQPALTPMERVMRALGEVDATERKKILDVVNAYFKETT
jgi:hypothetical protein